MSDATTRSIIKKNIFKQTITQLKKQEIDLMDEVSMAKDECDATMKKAKEVEAALEEESLVRRLFWKNCDS